MAKAQNSLFILRRVYAVAAEKVKVASTASIMREVSIGEPKETAKKVFWMRDPKTGNWKPENHFDDVDVAELREKLLSRKSHS
ncbi:hypothetical protein ACS0TY_035498 [Phlomoides rotata]